MNILYFVNEIPKHYDDFLHPTELTTSQCKHPLDHVLLPQHRFLHHLLAFALSLMEQKETYIQINPSGQLFVNAKKTYSHLISDLLGITRRHLPSLHHGKSAHLPSLNMQHRSVGLCFCKHQAGKTPSLNLLYLLEPYLSNNALIVINNANTQDFRNAVQWWISKTPGLSLLFDFPTPYPGYSTWDQGIQILAFHRKR